MSLRSVQFIVPTLKRVEHLNLCLTSILAQSVKPRTIFVAIRADDSESAALVESLNQPELIRKVAATGVGVIGAMSSCLDKADGDFIALVDDDVELPPAWLETMLMHLETHPDVAACSGRDLLQDDPGMRRLESLTHDVGRIHWYGRITGNHHRGKGAARKVDALRGSNVLFHGPFLRDVGFPQYLRGQGAQVNWELALAFQAAARALAFFHDPSVGVIHHTAPRHDQDLVHRGIFNFQGVYDMSFNETSVTLRHAPWRMKIAVIFWQFFVGSTTAPGLLNVLRKSLRGDPNTTRSFHAALTGRWRACLGKTDDPSFRKELSCA